MFFKRTSNVCFISYVNKNKLSNHFFSDSQKLDQFAKKDIKGILKQLHEGIQSLVQARKQDLSVLEVIIPKIEHTLAYIVWNWTN